MTMHTQMNIHGVKSIKVDHKRFKGDTSCQPFNRVGLTVEDENGEKFELNMYSMKKMDLGLEKVDG